MVIPQSIPSQMSQGLGKKTQVYQTPAPLLCQTASQQCQSSQKEEKVEKEMTPVVSPLIHQKRKRTKTVSTPPTVHPQSFVSKEKLREDFTSDKSSVTSAAHITTGSTSSIHNTNAKSRQVCFSRRRSTLFRKAYELSTPPTVHSQSFVSKEKQREDITSDKSSVTSAAHITTRSTSSVHNTNAKSRQVCFSRRRSTLFRKAYELSVLCGVHVKVIAFSPAGKLYSCAYPSNSNSVNSMFAKDKDLLDQNVVSISNSQTDNLSRQMSELTTRLKAAKKKNEALRAINSMFAKDKDLLDQNVVSNSNSQTDNLSRQMSELTTRLEAAKKKNEALRAIVKDSADVSKDGIS